LKPIACLLAVVLLALPAAAEVPATPSALAESRGRGWLTGTGLGLVGLSLLAGALGLSFQLTANDANRRVAAYYPPPNGAPTVEEARAVTQLVNQRDSAQALAVPLFLGAAAALAGGLACVVLDGGRAGAPVQVAVVPGPSAVSLWVTTRF
jgi:hypothetical protein